MTRPQNSPWRDLIHLLWRAAALSIPLALFFGTVTRSSLPGYLLAFRMSLYFAYTIGLAIWAFQHFVLPRLTWIQRGRRGVWWTTLAYTGVSMVAAALAALLIHFTLLPDFLGDARSVAAVGMFILLFSVLASGIALAVVFYQRSIDRARADEELVLARRIQRSFLLSQFPSMPSFEVHAVNVSSRQVSGDFYDVVPAGDDAFLLAIADVAGKGVPAALLSSMLQASLRTQAATVTSPAAILGNINSLVHRSTAVHQFATFFLARVEEDTLRLSYSNAGHNHPILIRPDGDRVALDRGGTVVGILESADFEEDHVQLGPGDRVVFYTDGISEATGARGEMFGEERLCRLVTSAPAGLSARDTTARIIDGVRAFLDGAEAGDDVTVMVLRVLESPPDSRAAETRATRSPSAPSVERRP